METSIAFSKNNILTLFLCYLQIKTFYSFFISDSHFIKNEIPFADLVRAFSRRTVYKLL